MGEKFILVKPVYGILTRTAVENIDYRNGNGNYQQILTITFNLTNVIKKAVYDLEMDTCKSHLREGHYVLPISSFEKFTKRMRLHKNKIDELKQDIVLYTENAPADVVLYAQEILAGNYFDVEFFDPYTTTNLK